QLPPETRDIWDAEGPHAKGQPVGDAVVHFVLRLLTLESVLCLAPPAGRGSHFVLVEEFLGHPFPTLDPSTARTEITRRYLHGYGPSTRADFAAWLGITATDAKAWWDAIADDLEQVSVEGRHAWLLAEDLPSLSSGPAFPGAPDSPHVRLLPPHDPYTQCRDRGTIVDKVYHRQVWKPVGDPGVLLVNGRIAGVWRPKKKGRTLTVTVSPFQPLTPAVQDAVRSEADGLGPFRGVGRVTVNIEDAFTSR
ncbi:MAG: winged helix DNA-binding domain-containing protein, partial [Mycobacteriaceae bacterium]